MIDNQRFSYDLSDAISKQNKILENRIETPHHKAFIKNAIAMKRDDSEFTNLLKNVFSHHDTASFHFIPFQSVNVDDTEDISRFFHHHEEFYVKPKIVQGQFYDNPELSYDELYERVIDAADTANRNLLSFLIGGVGIGKTTFICNFICRNLSKLQNDSFIPVKVNLDVSTAHTVPNRKEILEVVKRGILSGLKHNGGLKEVDIERIALDSKLPRDADEATADANLLHLVSLLKERHKKRIFLIIDNIDFLYHMGDRGFFAEGGDNHPERTNVREAHAAIVEIIKMFWLQTDRLSSRLGLPVLVACRQDTIAFLLSQHHEVPLTDIDEKLFSLAPPELDRARDVVEKRFDLMDRLISKTPNSAKKKEFGAQADRLRSLYGSRSRVGENLLDDLWHLSRKGLRDMINQISEYSWLEFLDGEKSNLNARFTQQYYPSMLAYMLAGRRRYTQFSGNLPNLYLINAPSPSNEIGVPLEFKEQHLYSLWLKRLILQYLDSRDGVNTNEIDIINMFCGKNRRGYSEPLVRYVLSSLFEVPTSELIEVEVGAEGNAGVVGYIKQIDITKRGRFLLNECADSFKYLQLAVDDWKILLPRPLLPYFEYVEPDYSYLVYNEADYGNSLNKVLQRKGLQTFLFAILIEEVLKYEKKTWPKVFERLDAAGVQVQSKVKTTERLRIEITEIKNALRIDLDTSYLNLEKERRVRALFQAKLEGLFLPCKQFREKHYKSW